jgi:uncharacterized protein YndB with AHSA1/START domain
MEYGSIEREIHIDAAPEVVFEVVSSPEHIREWWGGAETGLEPVAGSASELVWRDAASGRVDTVPITVVDAVPPRHFSFRWTHPSGETAVEGNSLLVTFELAPAGAGTVLRLTETGFREMGWEVAVLEETYRDHENGWDTFVPRIGGRALQIAPAR